MIKSYLRLSLKSILKQGHHSFLSAIGLSVALSSSILILLYVQYEFSYDRYHENADQIYRVVTKQTGNSYMGKDVFAVTPGTLKDALLYEIPEIKNATKCYLSSHTLEYNSSIFAESGFLYSDADLLKIFSFPVISGDPAELKEPFVLFLTKEMALKYFGNEDPSGKMIIADNKYVFTVRGILEDIPDNSHFHFDFLTGFETLYNIRGGKENVDRWGNNSYITYFQLISKAKPEELNSKLEKLYLKYRPNNRFSSNTKLIAEPLKGIHLGGNINFEPGKNNDIRYIFLISSIGIFIILIACFNYMNMATARSYSRGREVGIIKVAGGSKNNLVLQLITESVLVSAGGLILAFLIVWFVLPVFRGFTDRPLQFRMIFEYSIFIKIIGVMIFAGIFAGIYPAFHLASFSPLNLIKEDFKSLGGKRRSDYLRSVLVVFQYIISIMALICTFTVLRQLNFIKNTDLGYVRENIIYVTLKDPVFRKSSEVLMRELLSNPKIEEITPSATLPITVGSNSTGNWDGKPAETNLHIFKAGIGKNFIDFYNLKILSGRGFSDEYSTDTLNCYIINQTAAKMMGMDDPPGKKFGFNQTNGTIVGVIKDFYFHSLRLPVEPLAMSMIGSGEFKETRYISIKVKPGTISDTRIFVEKKLKELSPHYLNSVSILSDSVDAMYSSDRKLATIFVFSTVLALILTCLGQYSLSSYTTKSRTKEMVIRKVMGAQPSSIMAMLTMEQAKWVLISIIFACPVSYLLMNKWLRNFAYHIGFPADVFFLSLFVSLLISMITISYHVIKLSRVNPAEMIRHE